MTSKKLYILRGIPGSGKSTWCANLKSTILKRTGFYSGGISVEVFSTDDWFCQNPTGEYLFDPSKLKLAHQWNFERAERAMESGMENVVIDNTNVRREDFANYVEAGIRHGYEIVEEVFKCDVQTSFERNTHGVPLQAIERMASALAKSLQEDSNIGEDK